MSWIASNLKLNVTKKFVKKYKKIIIQSVKNKINRVKF